MRVLGFFAILVAISLTVPAGATEKKTTQQCGTEFQQCLKDCDTQHAGDTAAHAACVPTCSGKYAACDAGVAYEKAKPWIEEQADKTKRFFEGMMDDLKKRTTPEPEAQPDQPKPI